MRRDRRCAGTSVSGSDAEPRSWADEQPDAATSGMVVIRGTGPRADHLPDRAPLRRSRRRGPGHGPGLSRSLGGVHPGWPATPRPSFMPRPRPSYIPVPSPVADKTAESIDREPGGEARSAFCRPPADESWVSELEIAPAFVVDGLLSSPGDILIVGSRVSRRHRPSTGCRRPATRCPPRVPGGPARASLGMSPRPTQPAPRPGAGGGE
jgi:hypothetical protein